MDKKLIINNLKAEIILDRLASQVYELHYFFPNLKILSIQPRGIQFGRAVVDRIFEIFKVKISNGTIDPTFYRDDYQSNSRIMIPSSSSLGFEIEEQPILLIDDVLFTGRTTRAAINSLQDFGRPKWIKLLVLVNRHLEREMPIEVEYEGIRIDSNYNQQIKVIQNSKGKIEVFLINE